MIIQLVSFAINRFTLKERQFRIDSISKILNETAADFIMFSPYILNKKDDLETIAKNVRNKKVKALFELEETKQKNNRFYLIKEGSITNLNTNQIFVNSKEASVGNVNRLIEELDLHRKFEVAGRRFLLIECGENNILKGNSETAEFRITNRQDLKMHFSQILNDADIILNPVHSKWSRYGCFLSRLRKFSENKRYCFSCTCILDERQLERARKSPVKNVTQQAMHSKRLISPINPIKSEEFLLQTYEI